MALRISPRSWQLGLYAALGWVPSCGAVGTAESGIAGVGADTPGAGGGVAADAAVGPDASGGSASAGTGAGGVAAAGTSFGGSASGGVGPGGPVPEDGGGSGGNLHLANPFPCVPLANPPVDDFGFQTCEGELVRRYAERTCTFAPPQPGPAPDGAVDTCATHEGCNASELSFCERDRWSGGTICSEACQTDADCAEGSICECGAEVSRCVPATCTTDADCEGDLLCTLHSADPFENCGYRAYGCQSYQDACGGNLDCDGGGFCSDWGTRSCDGCVSIGRPVLVSGEARVAAAVARSDWATAELAPSLSVGPVSRAALAREWTRIALMEHASIAAFARFTLQLLQVAAPQDLIEQSNRAMHDEARHARMAFTLASAYGEQPVGPDTLDMSDSMNGWDVESLLVTTIEEGCIGETVAAMIAAEGSARAEDPVVRAALAEIADDENRHSQLAWRFVAWALTEYGQRAHDIVRREFQRHLNTRLAATALSVPGQELAIDLRRHGVLSPSQSWSLAAIARAEVIGPCAIELLRSVPAPFADNRPRSRELVA